MILEDKKPVIAEYQKSVLCLNKLNFQYLMFYLIPKSELQKIDYASVTVCPELLIKEISVQPKNGMIHINSDRKSVRYDTGAFTIADVGVQFFKYTVEIKPSPVVQQISEGEVTLDFRGKPMIFTPVCTVNSKNIKKTTER